MCRTRLVTFEESFKPTLFIKVKDRHCSMGLFLGNSEYVSVYVCLCVCVCVRWEL